MESSSINKNLKQYLKTRSHQFILSI